MAEVTKNNGDTGGINNVGGGRAFANATIINTGISSPLTAYNFQFVGGNLAPELGRGGNGTAGAVETLLNAISGNASILAYQVDTGATAANCQLSVITERSSWPNIAFMQANLRTVLASNIGAFGPITTTTMDIRSVGIKLAAS